MSCRAELPDGRARRFDVTAAAIMAESRRGAAADVEMAAPVVPAATPVATPVVETEDAPPSRSREICISLSILAAILGTIGIVVALVD